jgi:Amt family ammonium transporter
MGGIIALAGAMVLGPRIGKFNAQGRPNAMPGHHVPMVAWERLSWLSVGSGSIRVRPLPGPICASVTLW